MNLIQRIGLALNRNNYEYIKKEIEKSYNINKHGKYVTELIDNMNPTLIDFNLMVVAMYHGYKFNHNTPICMKSNAQFAKYIIEFYNNSDITCMILDNFLEKVVLENDYELFKLAINNNYYFSKDTPEYIKSNYTLVKYAITNTSSANFTNRIINNISEKLIFENDYELFKLAIDKGYFIVHNTISK